MCPYTAQVGRSWFPRRVATFSTMAVAFSAVDPQVFFPAKTVDGPRLEPKTTSTAARVIAIIFNVVKDAAIRLL